MVLDRGGHFSPAGIVRVHTSSLLLSSQSAHDRAAGNTREYKRRDHTNNTNVDKETWVQYKPRQGGMNSVLL